MTGKAKVIKQWTLYGETRTTFEFTVHQATNAFVTVTYTSNSAEQDFILKNFRDFEIPGTFVVILNADIRFEKRSKMPHKIIAWLRCPFIMVYKMEKSLIDEFLKVCINPII